MKGRGRWHGCVITTAFAVMTILFLSLLVLVPTLYVELSDDYNKQFGVVFTVEADHTHMIIYQWNGRKTFFKDSGIMVTTDTGIVQLVDQCLISSGSDSFAANVSLAGLSLLKCLDHAVCSDSHHTGQCIPPHRIGSAKAFLGATDSMRLLRHRDHVVADKILRYTHEAVKKIFHEHESSFILSYEEENVATIVGWNRMIETLPPKGDHQLYGVISMEELSAHVMLGEQFLVNNSSDRMKHLSLYNTTYTIYSNVDHCYGWNESMRMLSANLSLSHPATPTIDHPCLPQGYTWNITAGELFIKPCTDWSNPYHGDDVIQFTGSANGSSCTEAVNDKLFFNFSSSVINSTHNLTKIYAFSRYYEVMNFFNITDISDDVTGWSEMEQKVATYCSLSWDQILSSYPTTEPTLLARLCYDANLVCTLLRASGFVSTNTSGVWSIHCQQIEVPWPMGVMVDKTRNIKADPLKDRPFSDTVLVIGLLTFSVLTILFLFLLAFGLKSVCKRSTHHNQNGYVQIPQD